MNKYTERLYNGLIKENPTLVLMLGMCPTLAVSKFAMNGIYMGLSTTAVLVFSNLIISLLRRTVTELLIKAYLPAADEALGLYIPLIVVNCIILGRAEAYANKNEPGLAIMDGIGMGLGFTVALTLAGIVRELLGQGTVFGAQVLPESVPPVAIFGQAPGAFLVIALFIAIMNAIGIKTRQKQLVENDGCSGNCAACAMSCDDRKEEAK